MGVGALIDPGTGGARDLWRNVYRKAAEAAEARLQALLAEHVYHLHGRRAIVFVVDGGGAALTAGPGCDVELPWAYALEGWSLLADQIGSAVVDLRAAASLTAFPVTASLCAGEGAVKPTLAGAQKATSAGDPEALVGWTLALPRGTVLRPVLDSAATLTRLSLTLYVRAL